MESNEVMNLYISMIEFLFIYVLSLKYAYHYNSKLGYSYYFQKILWNIAIKKILSGKTKRKNVEDLTKFGMI